MTPARTVLVADDEPNIRRVLEALLTKDGYRVLTAENGKRAIDLAQANSVDMLITDLIMPDMTGVEVLRAIKQSNSDCAAIVVTAYGTIKTAVEAMRLGAYNYITKPFDVDEVRILVRKALEHQTRKASESVARPAAKASHKIETLIGGSAVMTELLSTVERAANSRATVL